MLLIHPGLEMKILKGNFVYYNIYEAGEQLVRSSPGCDQIYPIKEKPRRLCEILFQFVKTAAGLLTHCSLHLFITTVFILLLDPHLHF